MELDGAVLDAPDAGQSVDAGPLAIGCGALAPPEPAAASLPAWGAPSCGESPPLHAPRAQQPLSKSMARAERVGGQ